MLHIVFVSDPSSPPNIDPLKTHPQNRHHGTIKPNRLSRSHPLLLQSRETAPPLLAPQRPRTPMAVPLPTLPHRHLAPEPRHRQRPRSRVPAPDVAGGAADDPGQPDRGVPPRAARPSELSVLYGSVEGGAWVRDGVCKGSALEVDGS